MNLDWIHAEIETIKTAGLWRERRLCSDRQGGLFVSNGQRYVNFGSNDYLGLASSPTVQAAVIRCIQESGWGSGASSLVTGRSPQHAELERQIAHLKGTEAALVFSSGYAANVGVISAIAGPGDVIFSDAKNHASIIDGCRLSKATTVRYPHADTKALEKRLQRATAAGKRLIVTDSLFSMDGDVAPLNDLVHLAAKYDAMLLIDEAHATGVFGQRGSGVAEHLECCDKIDIHIGTFSKAFGSIGGYVAGSRDLIDFLYHRARTYVFSTALPVPAAAAAVAAVKIIRDEPQRRVQLLKRADELRKRLTETGWDTGRSCTQIVPIMVGDPSATMQLAQRILECGFFVPGIRPPTVPKGESMLRVSLTSDHSSQIVDRFCKVMEQLRAEFA